MHDFARVFEGHSLRIQKHETTNLRDANPFTPNCTVCQKVLNSYQSIQIQVSVMEKHKTKNVHISL